MPTPILCCVCATYIHTDLTLCLAPKCLSLFAPVEGNAIMNLFDVISGGGGVVVVRTMISLVLNNATQCSNGPLKISFKDCKLCIQHRVLFCGVSVQHALIRTLDVCPAPKVYIGCQKEFCTAIDTHSFRGTVK
eukprot:scaffold72082_cov38-Prasinocladus_malaysianus.AAC.1